MIYNTPCLLQGESAPEALLHSVLDQSSCVTPNSASQLELNTCSFFLTSPIHEKNVEGYAKTPSLKLFQEKAYFWSSQPSGFSMPITSNHLDVPSKEPIISMLNRRMYILDTMVWKTHMNTPSSQSSPWDYNGIYDRFGIDPPSGNA